MLTRFVSDNAWGTPEYIYPYDETVDLKNTKLYIAGNLNICKTPFLQNVKDISNNNYSVFYLTEKKSLSSLLTITEPQIITENKYPGILAINSPGGLITSETTFLECVPLYTHVNDFELFFASFNSTFTEISGATFLFSTVGPTATGYELGFAVDSLGEGSTPDPAIFNTKDPVVRNEVIAAVNMQTTAENLTSRLVGLNLCSYLSGSVEEISKQNSVVLTISAESGTWSGEDLAGYSITFGNTFYGDLTSNGILNYYRRFCLFFRVVGQSDFPIPEGYNENEIYPVRGPLFGFFPTNSTPEVVARALSGMFGEVRQGENYIPTQFWVDVKDVTYNNNSLSMTLTHKASGSLIEYYRSVDGFNNQKLIIQFNEIQKGIDSGFKLRFKPYETPTRINFKNQLPFKTFNTIYNSKAISDFTLEQFQNFKLETFESDFTTNIVENNNIFFDINFVDDKKLFITHTLYGRAAILISDDFNKKLFFVNKQFTSETLASLYEFSYLYDSTNNQIIIYKTINDVIYAICNRDGVLDYTIINSFEDIPSICIFHLFRFGNFDNNYNETIWGSYNRTLNSNSITLNQDRSFSVENNYLFHAEYNTFKDNITVNFLPLKNQLNEFYEQGRKIDSVDFRDYHSLYTGDNCEKGNLNISTGYITNSKEYIFKADQVTWFHVPYNETFKRIDINEANFVVNGAIAGSSPVFSDRIWKKAGDYKYISNLGNSKLEQTGQWLCAWLSGGDDANNAIWVDRFYNPEIVTEIEAIKFTNNVNYIPSYAGSKYTQGITDRKSDLKLEPGVWYAYSHVGKSDAHKVVDYIKKDIVQEGIIGLNLPNDGEYEFAGKNSGYISLENYKAPLNNFTLSFFGYSENWNNIIGNQILGNYLDSGFGIFNYLEINPYTFYFNKDKAYFYNIRNDKILSVTLPPSLSGEIIGMFVRNYHENYHYVLKDYSVLEYDLNGVLVDFVDLKDIVIDFANKQIISIHNNYNKGVILFNDLTYCVIDLRSNIPTYFNNTDDLINVNFESTGDIFSVYIDKDDQIYVINGRCPVLRNDKLYFVDNLEKKHLKVYNIVSNEIDLYIDTSQLESTGVRPEYTFFFENDLEEVSEFPYKTFNLKLLSGTSLNFYPPASAGIITTSKMGISLFREPYYFYNEIDQTYTTEIPESPIFVDLNGNHWLEQDNLDSVLEERELFADRLGFTTHIGQNNLIFYSDPEYQETLAATNLTLGRIFVYNLQNYKLNKLVEINLGGKNQVFELTYSTPQILDTPSFYDSLSSFPNQSNIVFSNGSEIYSNPIGEDSFNGVVSAFSVALALSSGNSITPLYHPDRFISNKFTMFFTPPLTAISNIVNQLTSLVNTTVVPHPSPNYTNKLHLSSFFNFTVTEQTVDRFTFRVENKFSGPTSLSARFSLDEVAQFIINNTTDPEPPELPQPPSQDEINAFIEQISETDKEMTFLSNLVIASGSLDFYEATKILPGVLPTGLDDQLFGYSIGTISFQDRNTFLNDRFCDRFIVSSPGWTINGVPTGKVTVYTQASFEENLEFDYAEAFDLLLPGSPPGVTFGLHLKALDSSDFRTNVLFKNEQKSSYVIVNATSNNSTAVPQSSALVYNVRSIASAPNPNDTLIYRLTGPALQEFAYKVGITEEFFAVSAPLSGQGGVGGVRLYRYKFESATPIIYQTVIAPPQNAKRFRFGESFAINYDYLVVGSLSAEETDTDNVTTKFIAVDFYKNNHRNEPFSYFDVEEGEVVREPLLTEYEYVSTVKINFLNNVISPTAIKLDINIYKNYFAVGIWTGDQAVFGDEQNKVLIYEIHKDTPIEVCDRYYENFNPTKIKKYFGRSVSLIEDKLITGTQFIYNTGHSLVYAVSGMSNSINRQSGLLSSSVDLADDTKFILSVFGNVSGEDSPPQVIQSINPDYAKLNTYRLTDYIPGRSLIYSGNILNFAFNLNEETLILTDFDRVKRYDTLGDYKDVVNLVQKGLTPSLSCIRFGINNVIDKGSISENYSFLAANRENEHFKINYSPNSDEFLIELIDGPADNEIIFPISDRDFESVVRYNFDITNCRFMESIIRPENLSPKLYFKIRLNNRLDYENALILNPQYTTENLSKGWHHFAVVLDSVNGRFIGYVDTVEAFNYKFDASKYVFSTILKDNLQVGTSPYYNNTPFDNFYKYKTPLFISDNIKMSDVKFYNISLTKPEIKFLSYTKFPPSDMKLQLEFGERNYIDTFERVSRHKLPGRKSTFIDIVINDSLITNKDLQKYFETKILSELKDVLPSYTRINKIEWNSNKPSRDKIIEGDVNLGNTLTNSGGVDETDILQSTAEQIEDRISNR